MRSHALLKSQLSFDNIMLPEMAEGIGSKEPVLFLYPS